MILEYLLLGWTVDPNRLAFGVLTLMYTGALAKVAASSRQQRRSFIRSEHRTKAPSATAWQGFESGPVGLLQKPLWLSERADGETERHARARFPALAVPFPGDHNLLSGLCPRRRQGATFFIFSRWWASQ